MKTLICICVVSICLLIADFNNQQVDMLVDVNDVNAVDDRNCVAIIDSKRVVSFPGILHSTLVEFALKSVHEDSVRVVMHGFGDTEEELISSILTTPCKVTSISIFSLQVVGDNIKFREDSRYVISLGNIDIESLIELYEYNFLYGKYDFADNVTLVAGSGYSGSFSCGYMKRFTSAKCVIPEVDQKSKLEPGVIEYEGHLYFGSSFAVPVYAGTLLKAIMNEK